METFSIRDLRERTGEPVRQAKAGRLSLVAKQGRPLFVALPPYSHSIISCTHSALEFHAKKIFVARDTVSQSVKNTGY